jgi:hypothetical protein
MKTIILAVLLTLISPFVLAQKVTSKKSIEITVEATTQAAADAKADDFEEDFILSQLPALAKPLLVEGGACSPNPNDIFLREAVDAVAPLVPCAVRTNPNGKRRVNASRLDIVFQRQVRQLLQRSVKDRRAIEGAEKERKAAIDAPDDIVDPPQM